MRYIIIFFVILNLMGCAGVDGRNEAPVINAWQQAGKAPEYYSVGRKETLYSIAWRFGLDFRALAERNHIESPYHIYAGQKLRITGNTTKHTQPPLTHRFNSRATTSPTVESLPIKQQAFVSAKKTKALPIASKAAPPAWLWPAKGKVIARFSANNKGFDIAGQMGEPVMTTASGVVVYAGSGLRGYGKLLIIKHNDEFLSAYAHNSELLVTEGERVTAGQIIAKMGNTDAKRVLLHFEIRQAGKPVDPARFIGSVH